MNKKQRKQLLIPSFKENTNIGGFHEEDGIFSFKDPKGKIIIPIDFLILLLKQKKITEIETIINAGNFVINKNKNFTIYLESILKEYSNNSRSNILSDNDNSVNKSFISFINKNKLSLFFLFLLVFVKVL